MYRIPVENKFNHFSHTHAHTAIMLRTRVWNWFRSRRKISFSRWESVMPPWKMSSVAKGLTLLSHLYVGLMFRRFMVTSCPSTHKYDICTGTLTRYSFSPTCKCCWVSSANNISVQKVCSQSDCLKKKRFASNNIFAVLFELPDNFRCVLVRFVSVIPLDGSVQLW